MTPHILQFFDIDHLPSHLQEHAWRFCELANELSATLPKNPETDMALRKLLEAKDCAVRSLLFK